MALTLETQYDADLQVISALQKVESNTSKPHRLEHHFVSKNRASLKSLRNQAISEGLQVSLVLSTGRLFRTHFFDVIIDAVPTIENITPTTTRMHQLAAAHSCLYDGWGCKAVV